MKRGQLLGLGATPAGDNRYRFYTWVPNATAVNVHLLEPNERTIPMTRDSEGYFEAVIDNVKPGTRYLYQLESDNADEKKARPDPASRCQPQGVHGPSEVISTGFRWADRQWHGVRLRDYIIYELHIGTFTPEGTFDAAIPRLDELKELGITAVEIMPIAQFPGTRNWGYDGVYPFAVQNSYGGPDGFKQLVNACHQKGLAVILDVVYNHLGPEGNYLNDYGPYFTDRYKTPWGDAVNFDGPYSDEVRAYFIENALFWITEYHVDALRLDATHSYMDFSSYTFLEELTQSVHDKGEQLHRHVYVIAENDMNNARLVTPVTHGGYGVDAQWSDDLHHCLHTLLTDEKQGYYQDYGELRQLAKAIREGFVYAGEYSPFRQRRHGTSSRNIPSSRLVICTQNHDQVGNRMLGERFTQIATFEGLKLAAGILFLTPYIPLLFMGEEYGETAPFNYFIDHGDQALLEATRKGRKEEFAAFMAHGEPPDPADEVAFQQSKLNPDLRRKSHHQVLLKFYKALIQLRKSNPVLQHLNKDLMEVVSYEKAKVLFVRRWYEDDEIFMVFNFCDERATICLPIPAGRWHKQIDSADEKWRAGRHRGAYAPPTADHINSDGEYTLPLSPNAFIVFEKEV